MNKYIISIAFVLFLVCNWLVFAVGMRATAFENRPLNQFPELKLSEAITKWPGSEISAAVRDRLPLRLVATWAGNNLQYHGFNDSPAQRVIKGKENGFI